MLILMTGGAGMVGKNVLEHSMAMAHDWLTPGREDINLTNREIVMDYIADRKPDLIIHLAGRVGGIQANMREPALFFLENMDMGLNVLVAARRNGVRRLINMGSSCMYPRKASNPFREDMILTGELESTNEGYGLAKVSVQRFAQYLSSKDSVFQYKTMIPCNLYGRWDKFGPRNSHMIPAVVRKIHEAKVAGREAVDIWGDGTARREFMYAGDLADCVMTAIDRFDALPVLMNVGVGRDLEINDYYRIIAEVVGFEGRFEHNLTKPAGMARKLVDISRQSQWGWAPKTGMAEGIRETYEFFLQHVDGALLERKEKST